jgi:hypothetical protein
MRLPSQRLSKCALSRSYRCGGAHGRPESVPVCDVWIGQNNAEEVAGRRPTEGRIDR